MIARRHEIARLQSDFFKNQYRRILRWIIASVVIMFALIAAIIYLVLFRPAQYYYANTTSGRILEMPKQV